MGGGGGADVAKKSLQKIVKQFMRKFTMKSNIQ